MITDRKHITQFLSRKFYHLLLPTTAVLITLILTPKLFPQAQETPPEPQSTHDPAIHLSLTPHQPTAQPNDTVQVDILSYAIDLNPTAAEIHIQYDPEVFEVPEQPLVQSSFLPTVLPNCEFGTLDAPCPAQSTSMDNIATIILSRECDDDGCILDEPSDTTPLATLNLTVKPDAPTGPTSLTLLDITDNPDHFTRTTALGEDWDVTGNRLATTITITPCALPFDFDADGTITVADIMQAAGRWMTDLSDPLYNGQFDLNRSGTINITDIQQIANSWGASCDTPPGQ